MQRVPRALLSVADAGPLNYLVLVGAAGGLEHLYEMTLIPRAVHLELQHPSTPDAVRRWSDRLPGSCSVVDLPAEQVEAGRHAGEREALTLAFARKADVLLTDDKAARVQARVLGGMRVIGTVGILFQMSLVSGRSLAEFDSRIANLRETTFFFGPTLDPIVQSLRRQLRA